MLEFLGIVLDTSKMEQRLSEERIDNLLSLLDQWDKEKDPELLSLSGKLAHSCRVVRVGKILLRRLINLSMQAAKLYHWCHLSTETDL